MQSSAVLTFDQQRYAALASPGDKEMFLFKWLSALDAHLETLATKEDVKNAQDKLETVLLEIAMIPQAAAAKAGGRLSWLGGGGNQQQQQQQTGTVLGAVPKPTRVIRDLVARCLSRMYELGDVHRMGDALYAIQTTMQAKRGSVEREARLAALVCGGVLFEALSTKAGFRLLSCFNDFVAIALKIIKTSAEPISVRVEATRMLGKLLQGGGGKTATEQQAKDILKAVRPNLNHKSPLLVLASASAIHALVACTLFMRPGALPPFDAESFVTGTLVPLLASPVLVVRRAIARLVAVVVANNVTLGTPIAPPSASQPDSDQVVRQSVAARAMSSIDTAVRNSVDANGTQSPASTQRPDDPSSRLSGDAGVAAASPNTMPPGVPVSGGDPEWSTTTLGRALAWLSTPFTRAGASRELRAGIVDAYAAVFDALGTAVAETHYGTISDHVLVDLVAGTQIPDGAEARDAEILGVRNMCAWLLRVPLAQRLLSEQGRLAAAQTVWDRWLAGPLPPAMRALLDDDAARGTSGARAWRAASPFAQRAPQSRIAGDEIAVLVAMNEWRHLVDGLGETVRALDVGGTGREVAVPLERWLAHPSDAMRVAAAAALGALVRHDHAARASSVLAALVSRLQQLCAHCAAATATGPDAMRAAIGYAYAVAAVVSPAPLMHVPLDLVEWVHGIAMRLLAAAYHRTAPAVVGAEAGARSADPSGAGASLGIGAASGIDVVALTNMRMHVGWILLTALAALGPDYTASRAHSLWTPLWAAALPQPDAGHAGFVAGNTPWPARAHMLQSRVMALTHLLAYLRGGSVVPGEAEAQRLVAAIRFALLFADNALDAPSAPGAAEPASRPTRLLPCQASVLESHIVLRARIAECLDAMGSGVPTVVQGVVPTAARLVESAIASPDNLCETFAARIAAASRGPHHRPSVIVADSARASTSSASTMGGNGRPSEPQSLSQRSFRSGPWGYEAETGTTTLLGAEFAAECSTMLSDAGAAPDFATSAMGGQEFDWVAAVVPALARAPTGRYSQISSPPPPYVRLVDAAVRLFGTMFPLLPEAAQLSQLDSLVQRLNELPFNSHRHAAVLTNILGALHAAAHACSRQGPSRAQPASATELLSPRVARAVVEVARAGLLMPSPAHRFVAGEIIGLLAMCTRDASTAYLPYLVDHLSDQAIRSRDRFARAGTAVALGSLYARAGSIAASRSLRQVVVLLHSLASDKDPVVHTWAIAALAEAALSAGFMFEPYARDTFQMALKLFLTDSHTVPLHASALWLRGKEHQPPASTTEVAAHVRVLAVRTSSVMPAHPETGGTSAQAAAAATGAAAVGTVAASGNDAAYVHPNSTTHNGRGADDAAWDASAADGDYRFVCARSDVDARDARAALGRLVSALIFVFGPELQVDSATRDAVLTLLRELQRALPSVIGAVPVSANHGDFAPVVDPDATWLAAAESIYASQKQLLFFAPANDPAFVPLLVRQTLRPIVRARGAASGDAVLALQRVAVPALESTLRLYGTRIAASLAENNGSFFWADWMLCDVVWEALALHNTASDQADGDSLVSVLQTLVSTAAGLAVAESHMTLVELLCAVFTKRAGALPGIDIGRHRSSSSSSSSGGYVRGAVASAIDSAASDALPLDGLRQFNSATQKLALAALVAVLDVVDRQRPEATTDGRWRAHPLTPLLAELVRVGYIASTVSAAQSSELSALGLHLVQRLVMQFSDVEDPAMQGEGMPVLAIYQAQLSSAFIPALDPQSVVLYPMRGHAAIATATAYVVSGLIGDRSTMVRILRLLAPQPVFRSLLGKSPSTATAADPLEESTPQMHILWRIAVLHAWAVILDYALRCRHDVLLDIVSIHVPLLSRMWVAAIRDAAAVGADQGADALEELARRSKREGGVRASSVDFGVGLALGLEATYVPLVRRPLTVWYRCYLPQFLSTVSQLLLQKGPESGDNVVPAMSSAMSKRVLEAGHSELMIQLNRSPDHRPGGGGQAVTPVLLLVLFVQELSRLSVVSSMSRYVVVAQEPESSGGDPFVRGALDRLMGALDVGGDGADDEAERVGALERSGVTVYGPTSSDSAVSVAWHSDMRLARSLLAALRALISNGDSDSLLFAWQWMPAALWSHAVSDYVGPLVVQRDALAEEKELGEQQRMCRDAWVDTAAMALELGYSLVRSLLENEEAGILFAAEQITGGKSPLSVLGLSEFGVRVVGDTMGVWTTAAACCNSNNGGTDDEKSRIKAMGLASRCLDIMGVVIMRAYTVVGRHSVSVSVSLWLELWRKSLLASGDPKTAAASVARFIGLFSSDKDGGEGALVVSMVGNLLSKHLCDKTGDVARTLAVVAWLMATVRVTASLEDLFVSSYVKQLESVQKNTAAERIVLEIPCILSQSPVFVAKARFARISIPLLAKLFYHSNDSRGVLEALCSFATSTYTDGAEQGMCVMAVVVMLLLSMVSPQGKGTDSDSALVGEAVVRLATAAPEQFRQIVVRLSATQPMAKQRLETAIRSQQAAAVKQPLMPAQSLDQEETAIVVDQPAAGKIVLKDSFGF
ncbi:hypothetical protein EV175_000579 [Coemansia sp. RSA 1933]|nr:hypothetical protein EV175_000579 [Coemansia sp. RSA 1933]